MIQVEVMSRDEVEAYVPKEGEVCISIRSVDPFYPNQLGDSDREIRLSDKFDDVLHLQFDDVDSSYLSEGQTRWVPLSKEQAQLVKDFASKHINDKQKLIVHCWGGISRSRSMAAAICKRHFLKQDFQVYNKWVYNLVVER